MGIFSKNQKTAAVGTTTTQEGVRDSGTQTDTFYQEQIFNPVLEEDYMEEEKIFTPNTPTSNDQHPTLPTTTPNTPAKEEAGRIPIMNNFSAPIAHKTPPSPTRPTLDTSHSGGILRSNSDTDQILQLVKKNIAHIAVATNNRDVDSVRILNTEILMSAPPNYFEKYIKDAQSIVAEVQGSLNDKGLTGILSDAQNNPTVQAKQNKAFNYVFASTVDILSKGYGWYNNEQRTVLQNIVINEILGFGPLDPFYRDKHVTEIICNGPFDIQIEIKGQMNKVESIKFLNEDHLMNLINRMYGSINKTVTRMSPLMDGRMHDRSRLMAVHTVSAMGGPNFSIRKHAKESWSPQDLINLDTASKEMLQEIGNWTNKGCSFLVAGGTGSGKTSLLNALSGYFKENSRILTLEDNIEMKLNSRKYLAAPMECVEPKADQVNSGITMRDLVKGALRLRPEGIIVGEVRDGAAYDLIQALNTGHWGWSTIHCNGPEDAVYRLSSMIQQGSSFSGMQSLPLIGSGFDFIIYIEKMVDGSRKITSVSEVGHKPERNEHGEIYLPIYPLWKYNIDPINYEDADWKVTGRWERVGNVSAEKRAYRYLDVVKDLSWDELVELSRVEKTDKVDR